MKTCKDCKFYLISTQECINTDFVRENLNDVAGWGEMMTDIMMDDGIIDTFGTPPDYSCEYWERRS
jgi:hypothetical protein